MNIPNIFFIWFFFCQGGFFFKSVLFYSVTARSDWLTGPKLNPEKNSGFSLSSIKTSTKCSKTVECCIISSGAKKKKKSFSRSVLSFLILCHHVLQTSRDDGDDDGWRDRQEEKRTKNNRTNKNQLKNNNRMQMMIKNISIIMDVVADAVVTQFSLWITTLLYASSF